MNNIYNFGHWTHLPHKSKPLKKINFKIFGCVVPFYAMAVLFVSTDTVMQKDGKEVTIHQKSLIWIKIASGPCPKLSLPIKTSSVSKGHLWVAPEVLNMRFCEGIQIILCIVKFLIRFRSLNASLASIVSICLPIVVEKKSCKKLSRWSFEIGMNIW